MESLRHTTRKSMLYRTNVEYGSWAMNHVQGCSHGCNYPCYAYLMAKRFGRVSSYADWCAPAIVDNTLELLSSELPRLADKMESVQLCFTTDPFMYGYEPICSMSLESIKMINNAGVPCVALTKGILPQELTAYSKENTYGITLISLDESFRERVEPGAAPYEERIAALKRLHDEGCKTWVSMEPYPTPNLITQDIGEILEAISFVDKVIFGRTHYNKIVSSYHGCKEFYDATAKRVIEYCQSANKNCHIKEGTLLKTASN